MPKNRLVVARKVIAGGIFLVLLSALANAQIRLKAEGSAPPSARDKQIAAQFAPIIYQGLGDQARRWRVHFSIGQAF